MSTVQTVRGPVDTADLGVTLMHEHGFVLTADSQQQWSDEWDEEGKVAEAVPKLRELVGAGVQTIVDPTVDGLGRNVPRIWNYLHVSRDVLPALLEKGVTQDQIDQMLVTNPRRFFES